MVEFSEFMRFVFPILILLGVFLFRGELFAFFFILLVSFFFWYFWFKILG